MTKEEAVVGARVVAIAEVDDVYLGGMSGTIVWIAKKGRYDIVVEFDEQIPCGHSGSGIGGSTLKGVGADGHCRAGSFSEFELEEHAQRVDLSFSFADLLGQ